MQERGGDDLAERAVELAREWLQLARQDTSRKEQATADRLHALVESTDGVEFAMGYVDRVARHRDHRLAAQQLAALISSERLPTFLGRVDRSLLRIGARLATKLPWLVMPLAGRRLRQLVGHMVVDARSEPLHQHIDRVRGADVALNINLLGEAVLGESEAARRFEATLDLINDPDIIYVSVKASAIASQIDLWSFDDSLRRVKDRLRGLYSAAMTTSPPVFVNMDMEEYKDLDLTLEAFMGVLSEPEFDQLVAGIVLQAYLPESLAALQRLTGWSQARHARTGAEVKVRLVKGANLAMERVDAAMHNWMQAPFPDKADVDANYKRCLDWILTPDHTAAVRVGVASHNLFDLAWAKLLADERQLAGRVDFEMLQGMAPPQERAVHAATGDLLLYTPIVTPEDFDVAISYLIRRLEENASGENFLRHLFSLEPHSDEFEAQARAFLTAVEASGSRQISTLRRGLVPTLDDGFDNHPDTDPSLPTTREWLQEVRSIQPTACHAPVTTDVAVIGEVLDLARAASPNWWARTSSERREILWSAADELENLRGEFLATMATEARKTFAQADTEITEAIDFARWYGDRARDLETISEASFEPFGVVVVVPPWNFPVAIPAGGTFAALAAGNAAILKPAPQTPRCAELIVEAAHRAGVPPDVLQLVRTPDDDVGRALVTGGDAVILTGSGETAQLFRSWRSDLPIIAETSGKNALIVTPHADIDLAVDDLVQSAFGHAGQKCSAASLAILVGDVADDPRFRRQLVDAVTSLRLGWPTDPAPNVGPAIAAVEGKLERALTSLDPGESWLVKPERLDSSGALWSPGVREGVEEGSWFQQTECFGPVLGLIRARDLDHAIAIQNSSSFGLTGGIHSLDQQEIGRWLAQVEVGNAYVNRQITGAIVRRQPFGGWKASSVGLGAKAGGGDYLLQLGRWTPVSLEGDWLELAEVSDSKHWDELYSRTHDPSALFCESNELRYLPHPGVVVRATLSADPIDVRRAVAAARRVRPDTLISVAEDSAHPNAGTDLRSLPGVVVEGDLAFEARLAGIRWGRVRLVGEAPTLAVACARNDIHLIDQPVTASGRLELRLYLREQAISRTLHRFGNVPTQLPP